MSPPGWWIPSQAGEGLIALPVLLMLGLPVPVALGTNKFQSLCGVSSSAWNYTRRGLVDLRACRLGITATFIGAVIGVLVVQKTDTHLLGRLIPWLLAVILVYTIFRPKLGEHDQPPRMGTNAFFVVAGLGWVSMMDFLARASVRSGRSRHRRDWAEFHESHRLHQGHEPHQQRRLRRPVQLCRTHDYPAGITMGAGQIIGGQLGSNLVMRKGVRFIRPIFLTIVTLTLVRLVWVNYR